MGKHIKPFKPVRMGKWVVNVAVKPRPFYGRGFLCESLPSGAIGFRSDLL